VKQEKHHQALSIREAGTLTVVNYNQKKRLQEGTLQSYRIEAGRDERQTDPLLLLFLHSSSFTL